MRAKTRIWEVLAVVGSLAILSGCASEELKARNLQLSTEVGNLQERSQQLEADLALLQRENENLRGQLSASSLESGRLKGDLNKLRQKLGPAGLEVEEREGLPAVILPEKVLFESGKADLTASGKTALSKLANVIKSDFPDSTIRVDGHTDSDSIQKTKKLWKSNWELGSARALTVLHYLEDHGISPKRLHASTYSLHRPLVPNTSAANKQKNRRVEVVILPGSK